MNTLTAPSPRRRLRLAVAALIVALGIPAGIVAWVIAAAAVTGLAEAVSGIPGAVQPAAAPVSAAPAAPVALACWIEPKPAAAGGPEKICGPRQLAPATAYGFTDYK